ncbi:unnamed protein product [Spirodela intermedia]|uniref:Uncharacterized protein n=1 Tax=Spirodela intermedia TaxID=51605 RepID=A0A7I8KM69_SPIIN|nr:unnamed protein product [Spirodela intermedia]
MRLEFCVSLLGSFGNRPWRHSAKSSSMGNLLVRLLFRGVSRPRPPLRVRYHCLRRGLQVPCGSERSGARHCGPDHGWFSCAELQVPVRGRAGKRSLALKEIWVPDSVGISENKCSPLVTSGDIFDQPFGNNTFDFIFSCCDTVELPKWPASLALEISWIMKSEGFESVLYSLHSFLGSFPGFKLEDGSLVAISTNKFSILEHKLKLLYSAEPQIKEDPLKPWITLKRNMEKSYRSSVGSWFEKQYPKKSKIFEVYAIETDRTYHSEYGSKKGVSLLPYAAWVRNETLSFEMSDDSDQKTEVNGRGMARIRSTEENIQVFDFVEWLKNTVSMADFVVMKLDMKGTEFDLIPASFDTGCHYNRWQKCCPQGRTPNTTIHMSSSCKFSLCSGCVEFMFISGGGCTITFIS